ASPPLDAVDAAPRGVLDDLGFPRGRMLREEAGIVGELHTLLLSQRLEGVGERHLPVHVMMPERFPVGRDVDDPWFIGTGWERMLQAFGQALTVAGELLERDVPRDRPVVEEDGQGTLRREAHQVRARWIDIASGHVEPFASSFAVRAEWPR